MELKIKANLNSICEINELLKAVKTIEKEYSCNCILVEVEIWKLGEQV